MDELKKCLLEYDLTEIEVDTILLEVQGVVDENVLLKTSYLTTVLGAVAYKLWKKWSRRKAINLAKRHLGADEAKKLKQSYIVLTHEFSDKNEKANALNNIKRTLLKIKLEAVDV